MSGAPTQASLNFFTSSVNTKGCKENHRSCTSLTLQYSTARVQLLYCSLHVHNKHYCTVHYMYTADTTVLFTAHSLTLELDVLNSILGHIWVVLHLVLKMGHLLSQQFLCDMNHTIYEYTQNIRTTCKLYVCMPYTRSKCTCMGSTHNGFRLKLFQSSVLPGFVQVTNVVLPQLQNEFCRLNRQQMSMHILVDE